MAITLNGTTGITTPTYGGSVPSEYITPVTSFKNRIINGAMVIDQRNAGASVTPTVNIVTYMTDRFSVFGNQSSKFSAQQNAGAVTPPEGFSNYLGVTSLSSYAVGSADVFLIQQNIEGFNCADLDWGTANAKAVTLSFQVYSSLTGTFGGVLKNSAADRTYPFSYSISVANTWTTISVTVAGDTTGTWLTDNGIGIRVQFGLGIGSTFSGTAGAWASANYVSATGATSVVGTNGATFYITGVQFEVGDTATSFDYRPYGQELALCQRYYETSNALYTTSSVPTMVAFKVTKRTAPTISVTQQGGATATVSSAAYIGTDAFRVSAASASDFSWTSSVEL